jgi:hypothetical protein
VVATDGEVGGKSVAWLMSVSLNCNATLGKMERRSG